MSDNGDIVQYLTENLCSVLHIVPFFSRGDAYENEK